jgi:uncharacterized protein (DUF885 family)
VNCLTKTNVVRLAVWIVLLAAAGGSVSFGEQSSYLPPGVSMADFVRQYQADARTVDAAMQLPGEGGFRVPVSDTALGQIEREETAWMKRLEALDFDRLDRASKLDYVLLRNAIGRSLDNLAQQRGGLVEIEELIGFRTAILDLERARRQGRAIDCRAAAEKLTAMTEKIKRIRDRIGKKGTPQVSASVRKDAAGREGKSDRLLRPEDVSPGVALHAAQAVAALKGTLDAWYKQHDGYMPEFDWWVKQPYEEARKQLDELAKVLREDIAEQKGKTDDPLVGQPIGSEAVAADIRREFLPCSAEELIAIGEQELVWCEGRMKEASREMGLGDDWKAALAKVKADFVPPGRQRELIAEIAREATDFARQQKLVRVPLLCREIWSMHMMSPEALKTVPYAAYSRPEMMVAYAHQSMPEDDKLMVMRGNNRHFMRLVTPHELIPGHHLQNFYAARYNTHRAAFSTPFYGEGWAFYWELRLWDLGWAKTPEDRIGMLFWRMTRAARIIVSLKYHLGRMTPPEMVAFLMERVGHEKFGATAEVRRFIAASPLYQVGYMIGGLQLYVLHKELVGGGKMYEEEFHDAVLKEGTMPIELLRADLEGLPLSRDMQPAWKFLDEAIQGR